MTLPAAGAIPFTWADVVAEARIHIGTPWVHQGRTPGVGLDCAGLGLVVARTFGCIVPDVAAYSRVPDGKTLATAFAASGWPECPPQAGAVVLMRIRNHPQHVGLLTHYVHGGLALLHALSTRGQVVEHRLDELWHGRILGAWALPGIDYTGAAR